MDFYLFNNWIIGERDYLKLTIYEETTKIVFSIK